MKKDSTLLNLSPFYDTETETIRVGGGLAQGQYRDFKKFPYLISKASTLAVLILRHCHEATLHGGELLTLNTIREEFWILNGKDTTRSYQGLCYLQQIRKQTTDANGGPPNGTNYSCETFLNSRTRFCMPNLHQISGENIHRSFVCFVIKAVHIELVESLTKEACMSAIKRFTARRGLPQKFFSDNGRNFIGTRDDIIRLQEIVNKDGNEKSIGNFVSQLGIEWLTIPPKAPHFGGIWEAAI